VSEFDGPIFKIQLCKMGEENPLDLQDAETIENNTLAASRHDLHKLLSAGYEIWIRGASGDPFTIKTEKYVIDNEAQNMLEDGYPLIVRRLHNSIVLKVNHNVEPFGIEAYGFYREHISKGELIEAFEPRTARLFDAMLRDKRR